MIQAKRRAGWGKVTLLERTAGVIQGDDPPVLITGFLADWFTIPFLRQPRLQFSETSVW